MPTIEFVANRIGMKKVIEAPEGGPLVDLCDEHFCPVPFSCRSASCGTCHIAVEEGVDLFLPPEEPEQELLDLLGGDGTSRLACQAEVKPGPGFIRVRPHLGS